MKGWRLCGSTQVAAAGPQIEKRSIRILVAPVYATFLDRVGEIRSRDMPFVGLSDVAGLMVLRHSGNALQLNFADEFNQPQAALNRKATLQAARAQGETAAGA
jgi:hypothetical protein